MKTAPDHQGRKHSRETTGEKVFNVVDIIIMLIVCVIILIPMLNVVSVSMSDDKYVAAAQVRQVVAADARRARRREETRGKRADAQFEAEKRNEEDEKSVEKHDRRAVVLPGPQNRRAGVDRRSRDRR